MPGTTPRLEHRRRTWAGARIDRWVQERLRWENWESLRKEAQEFAAREIRRRKWRGSRGGVLPEGMEAEDVVDQAIAEVLSGKCRLALGWVRERFMKELQRVIGQKIRQLHARKETRAMRSEWEMAAADESGEAVSILELLPDEGAETKWVLGRRELCQRLKADRLHPRVCVRCAGKRLGPGSSSMNYGSALSR